MVVPPTQLVHSPRHWVPLQAAAALLGVEHGGENREGSAGRHDGAAPARRQQVWGGQNLRPQCQKVAGLLHTSPQHPPTHTCIPRPCPRQRTQQSDLQEAKRPPKSGVFLSNPILVSCLNQTKVRGDGALLWHCPRTAPGSVGTTREGPLTRVAVAIQVPASSKGRAKEVRRVASCPQGLQNLGRLSAQPLWAPREDINNSLPGLPTKGSSNGHIWKTHTRQSSQHTRRSGVPTSPTRPQNCPRPPHCQSPYHQDPSTGIFKCLPA